MRISKLLSRILMMPVHNMVDGDGGGGGGSDRADLETLFADRDGDGADDSNDDSNAAGSDEDLDLDGTDHPDEQDDQQGDGADPVFEIPVGDGKTITKKQSELLAEASKYHGANQKFEEAAAIRKDAEAKLAQVPEREQQLSTVLQHYIRESHALMASQQPNWEALLAQDPAQYVRVRHEWEQRQTQLAQAMQVQATIEQRNAQAAAVSLQGRLKDEATKIVEAIPEFKDPGKAAEGAKAVGEYLVSQGIPAEMQSQMDTAAVFLIARKAMLYDQAIARRKTANEGTKQAPRVERPGSRQVQPPRDQMARANAGKAFKADPSVKNLAAFFE